MALLRMPLLPDQVDPSKITLVQSAGEIAALLENSKYDQAYPKFQVLLREYASIPFLHYSYGTALAALSQFDEAETQLRAELQISPRSELPYVSLASVALKRHPPAEALPSAQRAVQLAADSAESHYVLGLHTSNWARVSRPCWNLNEPASLLPVVQKCILISQRRMPRRNFRRRLNRSALFLRA
jgi:tetratricopeptide (TPR) repeat protein